MSSFLGHPTSQGLVLVNLACGPVFHPEWHNFDVIPVTPEVKQLDLRRPLPFKDGSVDACYASHVLEHLRRNDARALLAECYRIIKKEGIIRLVVPDLEAIVREYVGLLENVENGSSEAKQNYEWIMLELLDQLVRHDPGGDMYRYLTGGKVPNAQFVISRVGREAERLIGDGEGNKEVCKTRKYRSWTHYLRRIREEIVVHLAACFLGKDGSLAVREGLFRRSGEVHLWMYDRYSLRQLLETTGFREVRSCQAAESCIPAFQDYQLDTVKGRIRKPDSLFMEAIKPS
jgi:SAM-dependent methyltransferase